MTTTPLTPAAIAEILPVTLAPVATMRCARCGAQAYVEVQLPYGAATPGLHVDEVKGNRVEWCSHHYEQHETAMILVATKIIDHRPYLRSLERGSKAKDDRR